MGNRLPAVAGGRSNAAIFAVFAVTDFVSEMPDDLVLRCPRPKSVSAPPTHTPVSPVQRRGSVRIAFGMICSAAVVFPVLTTAEAAPQKYNYRKEDYRKDDYYGSGNYQKDYEKNYGAHKYERSYGKYDKGRDYKSYGDSDLYADYSMNYHDYKGDYMHRPASTNPVPTTRTTPSTGTKRTILARRRRSATVRATTTAPRTGAAITSNTPPGERPGCPTGG